MVEDRVIVTIFEIKRLNADIEELIPSKMVCGELDLNENMFIADDDVYPHINDVTSDKGGFALRSLIRVEKDASAGAYDEVVDVLFKHVSSSKYYRFSADRNKVYIVSDGVVSLLDDVDDISKYENNDDSYEIELPSPAALEEEIKKTIKGQDEAIRKIVTSIWVTLKFPEMTKKNMLVVGPTGVGKTAIFKKLQKILDIPLTIFSVPGLSQAGYVGRSTDELLKQIIYDCEGDVEAASHSIVILDEIDKIAFLNNESGSVSTDGVQNELLKIIEGVNRIVDLDGTGEYFEIDTSKMIFIGLGVFNSDKNERKESYGLGFNIGNQKMASENLVKCLDKFGMKRELLGRLPGIVEMNPMRKDILKDIILNSDESELNKTIAALKKLGVSVKNLDEFIDLIADDALDGGIGARGLVSTVNNIFLEIFYQVANNQGKYDEIVIGNNILKDNHDFKLYNSHDSNLDASHHSKKKIRTLK